MSVRRNSSLSFVNVEPREPEHDMDANPADEVKQLRRCVNDLVGIIALPAIWGGGTTPEIVRTLNEVVVDMLRLDLLYVRLESPSGGVPFETVRFAGSQSPVANPREIGRQLRQYLGKDPRNWPATVRARIGNEEISIAPFRLGLQGETGLIVAGVQRPDFPRQTESLLLTVAANQVVISLHEARLLDEQKRVASDLEQKVHARTAELRKSNEALVAEIAQRKNVEKAMQENQRLLHASEEQYRVVVETANEAVVSIDETSRILFANTATATIFGYSAAELSGQLLTILMPESFRPLHQRSIERYLATGKRNIDWRSVEVMARRKNGEEFPIDVSFGEVVRDGHRVFTGCIRDISERKKAEAAQAAHAKQAGIRADVSAAFSEAEDLKTILNACADAVVRHLGAAFARIWTLNESDRVLVLQASAGLYTRLDGAYARVPVGQLKIGRIAEEGKPYLTNDVPGDERVSDRDWARREGMVAFAGYPLFVEGRVSGVVAMFARRPLDRAVLDALELVADMIAQGIYRKDAADKLRQRERSLRLLTETIPQMIWSATASGETDYCNRQIVDYTGRQEDQLLGNGWAEVIHPDDLPALREAWRSAVANQLPFEGEFRQRRADGTFRWCLSRAQPLRDEQGRVIRWYGSITDLDDWKRAQETARRTQAELAHITRIMTMSELASSIAHEINQPLGAIANYGNASLRLLSAGLENMEDVKHALANIVSDANRASAIIAQVRALSKKAPPEKVALNVKELIDDVMALTRHELYTHLITVRTQYAESLPPVLGDRVQIQQLLLNLVMNAIEAMGAVPAKDRALMVRAEGHAWNAQRGVLVRVQDAGVGLPQQDSNRLFQAFYTTKSTGLGMGLAICRAIVDAHEGKLWAEPNEGPGATFCFALPADFPEES